MIQNLYIFRHGETFFSKNEIPYGENVLTAPILEEGIPSIKRIGETLKGIDSEYCVASPVLRCKQTVGIIKEISGNDFEFDDKITEYNNETIEALRQRVQEFINKLNEGGYKTVFICTHGAVIAALKHLCTSATFEIENLIDYPDTGIIVAIENGIVREINCNK